LERQNMQNGTFYDSADEEDMKIEPSFGEQRKRKRKRREYFDNIAQEVEEWAAHILFEEGCEEDGWKDVECSNLLKNKYNKDGKTKCYFKWLPDSRGKDAVPDDDKLYPCMRCYTTIDAPLDFVCDYLSDETNMKEYNDLVVKHHDIEDISPQSKICWGQCPQILFIKPREFITFCHHRWKNDGSQVVVNQAVDHDDAPISSGGGGKGNSCRAYALRGANFLSRDPNDPNITRFAILAHGNPGGDLPAWACKAAANACLPIEPFKLFYNIETGIKRKIQAENNEQVISSSTRTRGAYRPGGLSQLGYACFWPNGGGLKDEDTDELDE